MQSRLIERSAESPGVWSVYFAKPAGFVYTAGDYTELELDYPPVGGRRWFSLSSAPSERDLRITFRLPDPHSRFKSHLMRLEPGDSVAIAPAMGNFNLPVQPAKVLFVAAGIGVTPFRSMVAELTNKQRLADWDIKMLHTAKVGEKLFEPEFSRLGRDRQMLPPSQKLTAQLIKHQVSDYASRIIYLAGPETVTSPLHAEMAKTMPASRLRLSYFPNYQGLAD